MTHDMNALLDYDAMAADQFVDTSKRAFYGEPEKLLLLAVLQDAIHCFRRFSAAPDRAGQARFRETWNWLMAPVDEYIFSFANVCDALGLDPQYVRRGLIEWRARQVIRKKSTKGDGLRRRAA